MFIVFFLQTKKQPQNVTAFENQKYKQHQCIQFAGQA